MQPGICMRYSANKLNKQGDNIQPWRTPFPILNKSIAPRPVLTVASWPAYRFLRREVRRSGIPISFRIFHSDCKYHLHANNSEIYILSLYLSLDLIYIWGLFTLYPLLRCQIGMSSLTQPKENSWLTSTILLVSVCSITFNDAIIHPVA